MTKVQKIAEEIVPLSRRDNIVLGIIIACFFQFVLFYAPTLAAEAAQQPINNQPTETSEVVVNNPLIKSLRPDISATELGLPVMANTTPATTSLATSSQLYPKGLSTQDEAEGNKWEGDIDLFGSQDNGKEALSTIKVISTSTHVITAYNSEAQQTDASPCITANGYNVCESLEEDTIAANFLEFGTMVQIPELFGDRVFVVRDRMNKRHADRVDVWMKDRSDAIKFGVKTAKIQVVEKVN